MWLSSERPCAAPSAVATPHVAPLDAELRFMDQEEERFERLRAEIMDPDMASVPFASWFARRFLERRSVEGATAAWSELERADPTLARAALRLCWSRDEPAPHGVRAPLRGQRREHGGIRAKGHRPVRHSAS